MNDTKWLLDEISLILDYDFPKEVSWNPEMMEILTGSIPSDFPEYQEKLRERLENYYKTSKADPEDQWEEKGENQEWMKWDGSIQGSMEGENTPMWAVLKETKNTEAS